MVEANDANALPGRLFISLSPAVTEVLADEQLDLVHEIRDRLRPFGIQVRRDGSHVELESKGSREKEPATILVAAGLTAAAVGWAVSQVLDAIGRNKKVVVTERRIQPVIDAAGNAVRSKDGAPVLYVSEEARLIETVHAPNTSEVRAELGGDRLLKFELKSGG